MANEVNVRRAASDGRRVTLTTQTYFSDARSNIDEILAQFLDVAGRPDLRETLAYCVHELANNAKKANTKRVYFEARGLDMDDEPDYWIGMRDFRRETADGIGRYLPMLREAGLSIKVQFKLISDTLMIAVRNNVKLTAIERRKIEEKIARSRKCSDIAQAYASVEDSSEGAGLGIVMMLIMLRSLGLGENTLRFFTNSRETLALLSVPVRNPDGPTGTDAARSHANLMDTLPTDSVPIPGTPDG